MPNSKQIVYLSQAQYAELIANGSITVNGVTVTYDENDIYVTPQTEPVTDVRINGTSVATNGVANMPVASDNVLGVVRVPRDTWGLFVHSTQNYLGISKASDAEVKVGGNSYKPIVPYNQHQSTFYGLAKAAGADMKDIANTTVGIYPDAQKAAIQNMLGITDLLSTEETTTATAAHALNSLFLMGGKLYKATAAIAIGDAVVEGTNCEVVKADEVFPHDVQVNGTSVMTNGVANVPLASDNVFGVMKIMASNGIGLDANQRAYIVNATSQIIKTGTNEIRPITPNRQQESVFYGLSKVAGVDLANETVTLGTYPETSKTAIRSLIGAAAASDVTVSDVQVNGTSVLSGGIANIPVASTSDYGAVKLGGSGQTGLKLDSTSGILMLEEANTLAIKTATNNHNPITPYYQKESVFYGLASASGDTTQKSSSNAVGTYTETAKSAIRNMLGAASPDVIAVQDTQPTNTDTKVWLPETQATGVEVPTYAEFQALDSAVVKKTDIATSNTAGIVKVDSGYGITITSGGSIATYPASSGTIKAGGDGKRPIVPLLQHESVFYGLAKAAGDTTQSASDNAVGTYTADASAAIRSMLGAVGDVQVNGTSVVSSGVANVPVASYDDLGVIKVSSTYGLSMGSSGANANYIRIYPANSAGVKSGVEYYKPITPNVQHESTFYGLAKVAGDTTQSTSSNAVGTYTDSAKASIKSMLGIVDGSTGTVDITGTTPSITAVENTRYVCGEVSTLSFTPAASGICIVRFTSGSTATVLTVPNTVKFPEWFDITALEVDTIYEICITDGIYGAVMSWAL